MGGFGRIPLLNSYDVSTHLLLLYLERDVYVMPNFGWRCTLSDFELKGLIDSLKKEGVEAGENEAKRIVDEAKKRADAIIKDAEGKANKIVREAEEKNVKDRHDLEKDLKLAARDFFLKVKSELTELVALNPIRRAVDKEMQNPVFLKQLIQKMVTSYLEADINKDPSIAVTIPEEMEEQFVSDWKKMMFHELKNTPRLILDNEQDGFSISVDDRGEIVVDADSIVEALKPFLTEKFNRLLDQ